MIEIAICDDEHAEIKYLTVLVCQWAAERVVDVRLSDYDSAENFLFSYKNNMSVDILLLDIQMKNINGIELARQIRKADESMQIIFITGYADFITEGYDVSALHYLMKPVKDNKLFEVFDKAMERLKKTEKILLVSTADTTERIPLGNILFIESFAHYIVIQTYERQIETRVNIGEIEKSIGNMFIRCHRSYIVGLKHISRITKTDIILDNGKAVPLSRRLYKEINLAFIEFHKGGK